MPADSSRLGRVRMEDVGPELADETEQPRDGCGVDDRRDLPLESRHVDRLDPTLAGDVLHRSFALAAPGRRRGASRSRSVELARQVGDVERGAADIQAGDDAQNSDRLVDATGEGYASALRASA